MTEILRQHVAQSGSECHIVGDMKCFADTSLRLSEFFIISIIIYKLIKLIFVMFFITLYRQIFFTYILIRIERKVSVLIDIIN